MGLQSDITINAAKFDPAAIRNETNALNDGLIAKLKGAPRWWEVGAPEYRAMRLKGDTAFPPPKVLPEGIDITIPSRESGRQIPCRLFFPSARTSPEDRKKCKGTVCHVHGGGWVIGDEKSTDSLLQFYADAGDLAVISVGYRLSPEHPYPAANEDCFDVGEYLAKTSVQEYGGPLKFAGGESAGAHLSLLLAIHLLRVQPSLNLSGLLLHFGCFDLSGLPQHFNFKKPLILDEEVMSQFEKAYLPGRTAEDKKNPAISPMYEDLEKFRGRLPSALFTCGTEDPLLDDSVVMGTKWAMAGGHTIVKIYSGAPHGFIAFPPSLLKEAGEALADTQTYIMERMASS